MPDYLLFGGCLRSDLPFPELPPARLAAPDWTLRQRAPENREPGELLGEECVEPGVQVRLYRGVQGFTLAYDDVGTFMISDDGAAIDWYPGPAVRPPTARQDVLGRVLPLALHAAGVLTLHGSAVAIQGQGIAFLAPKHYGKSTLARALLGAGACLLGDDVIAVDAAGRQAAMRPGVQHLRLWPDAVAGLRLASVPTDSGSPKQVFADLAEDRLMATSVPATAVYLLAPRPADPAAPALVRTQLASVEAAMALLAHTKLGGLLGPMERQHLFQKAADLADAVSVYRLVVQRDFGRLEEAVDTLVGWHSSGIAGAPVAPW
jgi:hypothetical protein